VKTALLDPSSTLSSSSPAPQHSTTIPHDLTKSQKTLLAIGMLDLDDFKPVNDMHGHAAGDALLRELSKRLQKVLRQTDLLARLGGDEFVFVLENVTRMSDLELLLKRVRQAIETPFVLPDGGSVQVGGSMGITFYPSNAKESNAEGLLRHADHVLYLVKAKKGKRTRFWDWDWEYVIDPYQQGK
jgi:diguanylate cyclase (GGDEF)-like protein